MVEQVAEKLTIAEEGDEEKKHQSRGGKGLQRDEGVKLDKEALKRAVIPGGSFNFLNFNTICRRLDLH